MVAQPIVQRHHTVVSSTIMSLIAESAELPVGAELQFNSRDPFAVRVLFSIPGTPSVEWVFARELLVGGLNTPTGVGDVQVFPVADGIVLELDSPGGRARLLVDAKTLAQFVDDMLIAVPLGQEHRYFDIDREISKLARFQLPGSAQI